MKARNLLLRLTTGIAPLAAALAISSAPVAQAAAPPIVVDNVSPSNNCGKYSGKTAQTNVVTAINTAPSGSMVVICPGEYNLTGEIAISGKKLTIKRALTGPGSRPRLTIDTTVNRGIDISGSTVTIDGLILDASSNNSGGYRGVNASLSSVTMKNATLLGPNTGASAGIYADASGASKAYKLSITSSTIAGYQYVGVFALGAVKLNLKSSHLDATDGGRVSGMGGIGVFLDGSAAGPLAPTGVVTKSRILNNYFGIFIVASSKVSVTNNVMVDNTYGMQVGTNPGDSRNADNNKITGNTILGIPSAGIGVVISNNDAADATINKFTISKNVFVADRYGSDAVGVFIISNVAQAATITGSITSNTFIGIPTYFDAPDGPFAGVKDSGNDAQP